MRSLAAVLAAGLVLVSLGTGCARKQPETSPTTPAASPSVTADTDVTLALEIEPTSPIPAGNNVTFNLTLEAKRAITLEFATSQRYEFVVERSGTRVWGASDGKAYLQALGSESLGPGEERRYSEQWTADEPGEYVVTGSITSSDRSDLSVKKEFSVR